MEEEIKFIVFKNVNEIPKVNSLDGLCFYFANNIKADLELMEIPVSMHNINEGKGYDHYYLLAGEKKDYLIDPTYSQFLPKRGEKTIMFEDFPATILQKNERGKLILNSLLKDGFHHLEKGDLDIYLSSFKLKEREENKDENKIRISKKR